MAHRVIDWLRLEGTLKITKMFFLLLCLSSLEHIPKKIELGFGSLISLTVCWNIWCYRLSSGSCFSMAWLRHSFYIHLPWMVSKNQAFLLHSLHLLAGIKIQYFIWFRYILIMRNIWKLLCQGPVFFLTIGLFTTDIPLSNTLSWSIRFFFFKWAWTLNQFLLTFFPLLLILKLYLSAIKAWMSEGNFPRQSDGIQPLKIVAFSKCIPLAKYSQACFNTDIWVICCSSLHHTPYLSL